MSVSEFKVSRKEGNTAKVTVAFEKATLVVRDKPIGYVKKVFERRKNRESRFTNIRRYEMVRATLEYAESLNASLDKMYNDGPEMTNLNMVLRFEDKKTVRKFSENIFDVVVKALHELNKTI